MKPACGNCRWYDRDSRNDPLGAFGHCRVDAPTPHWPEVQRHQWCHRFEQADDREAVPWREHNEELQAQLHAERQALDRVKSMLKYEYGLEPKKERRW